MKLKSLKGIKGEKAIAAEVENWTIQECKDYIQKHKYNTSKNYKLKIVKEKMYEKELNNINNWNADECLNYLRENEDSVKKFRRPVLHLIKSWKK